MNINSLKESNYLKKEDCDPPILVTIDHMTQKNVALEGDTADMRWCLHFVEDYKPMILNPTNGQLIARALGSEETEDWTGKQIVLFNDPNVTYGGKLVGGIRARGAKKQPHRSVEINEPSSIDDDNIPF